MTVLYRYERYYAWEGEPVKPMLLDYPIKRKTLCGVWIQDGGYKERFVLNEARKKFAYPTKDEAFNSFKIRTQKAKAYATRDLRNANAFLEIIKKIEDDNKGTE